MFFSGESWQFLKDTSSIFPVFHGNGQTRHLAVDGQWNVETVFAFQVGDLGDFGMRKKPFRFGKKPKPPPKKEKNEVPILEMGDTIYLEHCEIHYFGCSFSA